MADLFKGLPVPDVLQQHRAHRALSDWAAGSALIEDRRAALDSDELLDGEILDKCVYELLALQAALEAYRLDD